MSTAPVVAMGFDYGTRRLGVAVGQSITRSAQPLDTLRWQEPALGYHWEALSKMVHEWQPHVLIVGVPLSLQGERQFTTQLAENFALELKKRFPALQVLGINEALTTKAAKWRHAEHSEQVVKTAPPKRWDAIAASLLVEAYLAGGEFVTF